MRMKPILKRKNKSEKVEKVRYTKIKHTLMLAYCVPVLLIVLLGVISYNMASEAVIDKCKASVSSTMSATDKYLSLVCDTVRNQVASIVTDTDVTNYYNNLYSRDSSDPEATKVYNAIFNSMGGTVKRTDFMADYYILCDHGKPFLSYEKSETQRRDSTSDKFSGFNSSVDFQSLGGKTSGWVSSHPFIDETYYGDPTRYAFSYMQMTQKSDGVVALDVDKAVIENTLAQMNLGEGSIAGLVVSADREVLVGQSNQDGVLTSNVMEDMIVFQSDALKSYIEDESLEGVTSEIVYQGQNSLFYKVHIGDTGLVLCSLVPVSSLTKEMNEIRTTTVVLVLVAIVIALGTGTIISNGISRLLTKICKSLRKVADGDFTQEFHSKRKDELRILTDTLQETVTKIRGLLLEVSEFSAQVDGASSDVAHASENVSTSIQQVSESLNNVAMGVEAQAGDADTCAAQMDNFSTEMDEVSVSAQQINVTVQETLDCTQRGNHTIEEMNEQANLTTQTVNALMEDIGEVVTHAQDIYGIINTINEIAEQTNLLSLNASIEAARAGEAGRGFSVVAEEIRKLADQSLKAGDEIYGILDKVNTSTKNAAASAERTTSYMDKQGVVLQETTQVFSDISKCVDEMVTQLNSITKHLQDMMGNKDAVATSINSIAAVSEEVAVSTRTVSDSIEIQLQELMLLAKEAGGLSLKAKSLDDSMSNLVI